MLDIKNNSNLLLKAFQRFLSNKEPEDLLNQIGIWIFGYVVRRLRATDDEASLVFLKFWLERNKLVTYFKTRGCKNIFGFLTFFSKNLLLSVRRAEANIQSIDEFVTSNEISKTIENTSITSLTSKKILRCALKKLSIMNRVILCLRYGFSLTKKEKDFLLYLLKDRSKYIKLITELQNRIKKQKSKDSQNIEKLNLYHWRYTALGNSNVLLSRKKKLQKEIFKLSEVFTFKEISSFLGISTYKISQSCEYSLQFIAKDLDLLKVKNLIEYENK